VHDWYAPKEIEIVVNGESSSAARPISVNFCKQGKLLPGKEVPAGSCGDAQ
jgi:hypothetical protein